MPIKVYVTSRLKQSLVSLLGLALIPALAYAAAPPITTVDPALLARANAGDAAAQLQAGNAYIQGDGAARESTQLADDYRQAAEWYRKAAVLGIAAAQIHLADLYRDGRGVERD